MASIAQVIRDKHAAIMRRWRKLAATAASAKGLSAPALETVMSRYLSALADDDAGAVKERRKLLESHLASRLRQGFVLPEIVSELLTLGRCIAEVCSDVPEPKRPDPARLVPILAELQHAATTASEIFWQHLREDEQVEKGLLRRLQTIATASRDDPHRGGFTAHLQEALALIVEGVPARCLSIALVEGELTVAAAVGGAPETRGGPPRPDLHDVFDDVAKSEEGSAVERALDDDERVVAVRLPEHGPLVGILYAVRAREPFAAREVRRLEAIAAFLGVLLENSRLYAALRLQIEESETEKRLRETFVSVLAHDLRGPLSVSRLAAAAIAKMPEAADIRQKLADRVVSGIDRADRMVTDLLDANRIRAGERLALDLGSCDLAAIAREVAGELAPVHGDRFAVSGDSSVQGIWSAEHLRRIVTNLATNAAKYGAPDTPVELDVHATDAGATLSVHNAGNPISADELPRLFEPFSRTHSSRQSGIAGWGLGLALVKGSVEAHGGSVSVQSSQRKGTTFTVALPRDARPFQAEATGTRGDSP